MYSMHCEQSIGLLVVGVTVFKGTTTLCDHMCKLVTWAVRVCINNFACLHVCTFHQRHTHLASFKGGSKRRSNAVHIPQEPGLATAFRSPAVYSGWCRYCDTCLSAFVSYETVNSLVPRCCAQICSLISSMHATCFRGI